MDAEGNAHVVGHSTGPFTLGAVSVPNEGDVDGFVAVVAPDGTVLEGATRGGPLRDSIVEVALDGDRRFVAGTLDDAVGCDPTADPGTDGFLELHP